MSAKSVGAREMVQAWGRILSGYSPNLSIEITRECPLRCPGCYAYGDEHLGGDGVTLRGLADYKGDELVSRFMAMIDQHKPLHVSIVGGEPLVRYRELNKILPQLAERGVHTQLVTSAVRPIPQEWIGLNRLQIVVSIDGLQPEHDVRRTPATYDRILKHIEGHQITVHCTVTRQQVRREGYLEEFLTFWQSNPHTRLMWVSLYTPQIGELSTERLTKADRTQVVADLRRLRSQVLQAADAGRDAERLCRPAEVARRLHLRADHRVLLVGPREEDHALPVRRQPGLLAVRLHRLGRPGSHRTAPSEGRIACRQDFLRLAPRRKSGGQGTAGDHSTVPSASSTAISAQRSRRARLTPACPARFTPDRAGNHLDRGGRILRS